MIMKVTSGHVTQGSHENDASYVFVGASMILAIKE